MKKTLTKTAIFFLKLLGQMPFGLLYLFSDVFFVLTCHVVQYRKKTVYQNLRNAFPEKSHEEIKQIAVRFYRHFADMIFETLKSFRISQDELSKRFRYVNPEVVNDLYDQGKSVALLSGHYGNWEWGVAMPKYFKHQVNTIYRTIENETFNEWMKKVRSRFGIFLMPQLISMRTMLNLQKSGQLSVTYFLTDQTALKDTEYWVMFLNQETPVFPGAEKVSTKFKLAVVFMDIQKVSRGHYEVRFTKLFDDGSQTRPFEITKAHVKFLEDIIREKPEYWLWSHRRWKHKRPETIAVK
jgi:KDO2-lipid IV(A) lauroyltransferase